MACEASRPLTLKSQVQKRDEHIHRALFCPFFLYRYYRLGPRTAVDPLTPSLSPSIGEVAEVGGRLLAVRAPRSRGRRCVRGGRPRLRPEARWTPC